MTSSIPDKINGVTIEFAPDVKNALHPDLVEALKYIIRKNIAPEFSLTRIYISSVSDGVHDPNSRHYQFKAVDISRINGIHLINGYQNSLEIRFIADAIQDLFESIRYRRENFGPCFKKKLGQPWPVSGHLDHIHLSVN